MNLLGAILAGGQSSRFGSDKAFAEINGDPLISHVAKSLSSCDGVIVVGRAKDPVLEKLGLDCIADIEGGSGPVLGLVGALKFARENEYSHIFLTSCDMWGLLPDWPRLLASSAHPVSAIYDEHWQPMCSSWRSDVEISNLSTGKRGPSLKGFLESLKATQVAPPQGWEHVRSINTPEDLLFVEQVLAKNRCGTD